MAYVEPTVDDLIARFPEFENVSDIVLDLVLAEAIGQVDSSWVERDRRAAQLYLAAHMLAMEGEPMRSAGAGTGSDGSTDWLNGPIKRDKVGDVETEFAGFGLGNGEGGGASGSEYALTRYGQMYLSLLRRNFPAVAVV
jgi:hypothetical protein